MWVAVGVSVLCALTSVIVFTRWAAVVRRLAAVEHRGYTIDRIPEQIPDVVMMDSPALCFRIGKKRLYVKPLTIANKDRFIREYAGFLRMHAAQLEGLKLYEYGELLDLSGIDTEEIVRKASIVFAHQAVAVSFCRVIQSCMLNDDAGNPDKISFKYLIRNIDTNQLCQIFYAIYGYNIGFEKKNLQAQLQRIGAVLSGESVTPGLGSTKSGDLTPNSGYVSPFRESVFYPEHLKRSMDTTRKSRTNEPEK